MENNENDSTSLLDTLKQQTETKAPAQTNKTFEWNFEEETDIKEKPEAATTTNTTAQPGQTEEKKTIVVSDREKEKNQLTSAETLTASLDLVFDLGGSLYLAQRFKKNFTDDEWEKVKELQDVDKDTLTDKDLILKNRFTRLEKKRKEKIKELAFEEEATARLNRIFFNYYKVTGKEISPETMLYLGVTTAILEKVQTIFFD